MNVTECFVCNIEDSRAVYRICKCDICIHDECFRKLVSVPSHSTSCAVCREPYAMSVKYQKKIHCECILVSLIILDTMVTGLLPVLFVTKKSWEQSMALVIAKMAIICATIFINATTVLIFYNHYRKYGNLYCIYPKRIVSHKELQLSNPIAGVITTSSSEVSVISPL